MVTPTEGLEMGGINATPILTKVMNVRPFGYRSNKQKMARSVGANHATGEIKLPVSSVITGGGPFPAAVRDFAPFGVESLLLVHDCLRKGYEGQQRKKIIK
jgi:hypothetical protein